MQPSQIAIIWTMFEEQQRSAEASRSAKASPRPSFTQRFRGQVHRFVYRTQLGPVSGHAPA